MAPQSPAYDVDWIYSHTSDVHVAKHRDWFTRFTEFKTGVTQTMGNAIECLGIGTVELDVKTDETIGPNEPRRTIVLRNVLYAPTALCNILGNPIRRDYSTVIDWDTNTGVLEEKETGACAGLFDDSNTLTKLWLVGQPKGMSSLDPKGDYVISVQWPNSEGARWKLHQLLLMPSPKEESEKRTTAASHGPPYRTAEKAWLKVAFGGEFHFLKRYGLGMSEDDREEGRHLARKLIKDDAKEEDSISKVQVLLSTVTLGEGYVPHI